MPPIEQSIHEAMILSKETRIRVLEGINEEQGNFADIREEQVKLSQEERSKINFLAFAIVGSVLGFSADSLQNPLVLIGLSLILLNSFLFGFVADAVQRNLNIRNAESALMDVRKTVKPYFDAYDDVVKLLDDPAFTPAAFQEKYNVLQNSYALYLEEHKQKNEGPRLAKKTKLGIGYWYFILFAIGITFLAVGLVLQNSPSSPMVFDHYWHQRR